MSAELQHESLDFRAFPLRKHWDDPVPIDDVGHPLDAHVWLNDDEASYGGMDTPIYIQITPQDDNDRRIGNSLVGYLSRKDALMLGTALLKMAKRKILVVTDEWGHTHSFNNPLKVEEK